VLIVQNPHLYEAPTVEMTWHQRLRLFVLRRWAKASAARATVIVCTTRSSADAVIASTRADPDRVHVEPVPAIDVAQQKHDHRDVIERVLLVGDVYRYKCMDVAVDAVAAFASRTGRKITVVHIGAVREAVAGTDFDRAIERASPHGVTVEKRGATSHPTVIDEMTQADVLLLASTTETQGMPLIEAHSVGLPTVARGIGAFADLADDASVLTAADASADEFAAALLQIDARPEREALAQRGATAHPPAKWWPLPDHLRRLSTAH
jgi:glycosyltransferase involved in cell wall biosynthesis